MGIELDISLRPIPHLGACSQANKWEFQWNPRSGSSLHRFQVELGNLEMSVFVEGGKQKTPQSKDENQQQTQPTYDALVSGN